MNLKHGEGYGDKRTVEFITWTNIKQRCYNPNKQHFEHYGGRGIKVCSRWKDSFENFLNDMGRRPGIGYTIERKNRDGDYEPSNCVWLKNFHQQSNRSNNKRIEYAGKNLTYAEWERKMSLPTDKISSRMRLGWDPIMAITTPNMTHMARR